MRGRRGAALKGRSMPSGDVKGAGGGGGGGGGSTLRRRSMHSGYLQRAFIHLKVSH